MIEPRPASRLVINALQRAVFERGGFAAVLRKGDPIAGQIIVQCSENGMNPRLLEQMPGWDGPGKWVRIWPSETGKALDLKDYLDKRTANDPDLWLIELDIADGERLVAQLTGKA